MTILQGIREMNNKLIFLAAIILVLLVPNVYASGPRHDYPDPPPTPYSTDCYEMDTKQVLPENMIKIELGNVLK